MPEVFEINKWCHWQLCWPTVNCKDRGKWVDDLLSVTAQGRGYSEILQPIITIAHPIEPLRRTSPVDTRTDGAWAKGAEITQDGPGPNPQFGRLPRPVKILPVKQKTVLLSRQPIDPVAGAVSRGMVISLGEQRGLFT